MTTPTQAPPAAPVKKRGRENVRDMLLSMAACLAVILPIWLLGQPDPDNSKAIRPVDPTADVAAFREAAPGVPVPVTPQGWIPTSSNLDGDHLRIGYVTPDEGYVEYAAQGGESEAFLVEQTGKGTAGGSLTVGSRSFAVWSNSDAHTSLVLQQPAGAVVVGGLRETAGDEELTELAATLR